MRITLLGMGTPTPSLKRMSSGNLFFSEDGMVIPVGDPLPAKLD